MRFGHHTRYMHACRENFLVELAKHGMTKRDIVSNINFFMNVPIRPDGELAIVDGASKPGDYVELQGRDGCALRDLQLSAGQQSLQRLQADAGARSDLGRLGKMFRTVLVANRGEIAARIIRTLKRLGIEAIGVASDSDRFTPPMRSADRVMRLGSGTVAQTYLNVDAIVAAARASGAQAIHPGYGFLSENAAFAERLAHEGIVFIGPRPEHIREFGTKHGARAIAEQCGVPLLPGSGFAERRGARADRSREDRLSRDAQEHRRRRRHRHAALRRRRASSPIASPRSRGWRPTISAMRGCSSNASSRVPGISRCRFSATAQGGVIALGERDCSVQRRNQKVIEETPAPDLDDATRTRLRDAAIALGCAVKYESAGTVEFLYDVDREEPYFLEVNTRLQVEHPVTEEVFGVDLVEWMIRQAAGEFVLPNQDALQPRGHAIEVRLYAEDPARNFRPSTGVITGLSFPEEARVESWIERGTDDHLALRSAAGEDRGQGRRPRRCAVAVCCARSTRRACRGSKPISTYLSAIAAARVLPIRQGDDREPLRTRLRPARIEVVEPGTHSSLQDWPGRIGYWDVGVPPSGPMDDRSHRIVNRIVGNAEGAATLECTLCGPGAALSVATPRSRSAARSWRRRSMARRVPYWQHSHGQGRPGAGARPDRGAGHAHLSRRARRVRRAALSRLARDLCARRFRRPRDRHDQGRRHAAHRQESRAPRRCRPPDDELPALDATRGRSAFSTDRTARPTI